MQQSTTPEDNLVITNNSVSIKRLSTSECRSKKLVVITKCLCDPCPRLYTDIFKTILIVCNHLSHKNDRYSEDVKVDNTIRHLMKEVGSP